jgi:hypothetical protein
VGTSLRALPLGVDLVREFPQVGCGLAQIGPLAMDGAGVCRGGEGDHHPELLERGFHGCSFAQMTLGTSPAVEGIIPSSCLRYSRRVMALLGAELGAAPLVLGRLRGSVMQVYRFPKAQMSLASQARSDDPSAPTCFAHQSMHIKVVSARDASVVRTTAGHPPRVAAG